MGSRQWVPVSDQATRGVFIHGKVKVELQASFSCKDRREAEPRLNNKEMLLVGFSFYTLCERKLLVLGIAKAMVGRRGFPMLCLPCS